MLTACHNRARGWNTSPLSIAFMGIEIAFGMQTIDVAIASQTCMCRLVSNGDQCIYKMVIAEAGGRLYLSAGGV